MTLGVEVGVQGMLARARRIVGNDGLSLFFGDDGAECVGVIGGASDHHFGRQPFDERAGLRRVARLAAGEDETDRASQAADGEVDFGGQPAARAADGLILSPPFAPLAC
jgi:hypothetical protein